MKRNGIFSVMALAVTMLLSCSGQPSEKKVDTGAGKTKGDTSIVSKRGAGIPHDSVSGDPSSKGAADPDATLPKK